jgi:hypothetical protein
MAEQAEQATGTRHSPGPAGYGVDLRIDELALYGFRPGDRYAIAAAVEQELSRLLMEEGAPALDARSSFRVDAGAFEAPHDATPDAVGTQVARAIHHSLAAARSADRKVETGNR